MKVSLSWLNTYIPIEMNAQELSDALTMAGLEVDAITDRYAYLNSVIIGRITAIKNHPNADRLKICDVDVKDRSLSVVCGAPNAREGITVVVASHAWRHIKQLGLRRLTHRTHAYASEKLTETVVSG